MDPNHCPGDLMGYETARMLLGAQLERLQKATKAADVEIAASRRNLTTWEQKKDELLAETKDVASALAQLGGPVPNWTDDKALIAFWDEVKDEVEDA